MSVCHDTTVIVKEITIAAPASSVFQALTDPHELVQWWGDDALYRLVTIESDVRPGGSWRIVGERSDGETFIVCGAYRIVQPPRLLEYSWIHDDGESNITTVRFELSERNGRTHLRLTHSGFRDTASRDDHERGWSLVLDWLRSFIVRP